MSFCPFPHSTRDQVWLALGVGLGTVVARRFFAKQAKKGKVSVLLIQWEFSSVAQKNQFKSHWERNAEVAMNTDSTCLSYDFCESAEDPQKAISYLRYSQEAKKIQASLDQWQLECVKSVESLGQVKKQATSYIQDL
mmetsp:Transcript_51072/g.114764  ORF Transcript_51072/g.114764 Transcript_51072/m.114764 type:complete len:137 (+) Transcript_51072:54-464(+)